MTFNYEIRVGFHEDFATDAIRGRYWDFLSKYNGNSIGNKATESSTAIIQSKEELTKEGLAEILGEDIPILSFKGLE